MHSQAQLVTFVYKGLKVVKISGPVDEHVASVGPAVHSGLRLGVRRLEEYSTVGRTHIHYKVGKSAFFEFCDVAGDVFPGIGKLFPVALATYPYIGVIGPERIGGRRGGRFSSPVDFRRLLARLCAGCKNEQRSQYQCFIFHTILHIRNLQPGARCRQRVVSLPARLQA